MTSLAEEIAALINPAPTLIEPEDNIDFDTKATVVEKYEGDDVQVNQSQLRKRNVQINLDSKYAGKKISRKQLLDYSDSESVSGDDDDEEVEEEEDEDDDDNDDGVDIEYETEDHLLQDKRISSKKKHLSSNVSRQKYESASSDEEKALEDLEHDVADESAKSDVDEDEEDKEESIDDDDDDEEEDDDDDDDDGVDLVQKFSNIDVGEEIEKGKAVKSQLTLWDCLLECRIKLQKLLVVTNKLPRPDSFGHFLEEGGVDYNNFTKEGSSSITKLLDLLIDVQTKLLQRNPETRYVLDDNSRNLKENSDEEISGSSDEEESEVEEIDDERCGNEKNDH